MENMIAPAPAEVTKNVQIATAEDLNTKDPSALQKLIEFLKRFFEKFVGKGKQIPVQTEVFYNEQAEQIMARATGPQPAVAAFDHYLQAVRPQILHVAAILAAYKADPATFKHLREAFISALEEGTGTKVETDPQLWAIVSALDETVGTLPAFDLKAAEQRMRAAEALSDPAKRMQAMREVLREMAAAKIAQGDQLQAQDQVEEEEESSERPS